MTDLDRHLSAIAAGDTDAFALWVAGAEPRLRLALASFGAAVDVEAVVQEALLRAWNHADELQPDGRPEVLLRFSLRCARHLALDLARRAGRQLEWPELDEDFVPRELPKPPDPFLAESVQHCREQLTGQPRRAFDARFADAGSQSEESLAASVGMSWSTFLKNVARARKALEECLRLRGVELLDYLGDSKA